MAGNLFLFNAYTGKLSTPKFTQGKSSGPRTVSWSNGTDGVTFYYTLDGSNPTGTSPSGTSVEVTQTTTIKVIAIKSGYIASDMASITVTI